MCTRPQTGHRFADIGKVRYIRTQSNEAVTARRPSFLHRTIAVLAILAWIAAATGLAARYLPVANHVVLLVGVTSPYLALGGLLAVLLFSLHRRWLLAALAVALVAASIAVQLPLFVGDTRGPTGVRVRIVTANLYLGQADPKVVVETAQVNADILAVQELTPTAVKRLSAAGLDHDFPYRVLDAREEASGTGLWSRFPLKDARTVSGYWHAMITARAEVPGVAVDPVLFITHLSGPWPMPLTDWNRDYTRLPTALDNIARTAGSGCVIAAGDFNATVDLRPFRRLLTNGYRDAADQTGAGITATYPANSWVPPVLAIDHVLTRQCAATSVRTLSLPGSDHRGLASEVQIPRNLTVRD
jgi:endonuclease/exonuclease/phosphatase (EEP) superfamily protein YafD